MDSSKLRIIQINLAKSRCASNEIGTQLDKGRADVLLLQEPYVFQGKVRCLGPSAAVMHARSAERNGIQTAAAVRKGVYTTLVLGHLSDRLMTTLQVTGTFGSIYCISVYFQYALSVDVGIQRIERALRQLRGKPVIVAADANAISQLWDPLMQRRARNDRRVSRGARLERFILAENLVVLNDRNELPTFRGNAAGGESYIDITLATPEAARLVSEWRVLDDVSMSDHRPIVITLDWERDRPPQLLAERLGRYNTKNVNWEAFDETLEAETRSRALGDPDAQHTAEELAAEIQRSILAACDRATKRRAWHARTSPGWTPEVKALKRAAYRARRELQQARDPLIREQRLAEYRAARSAYKGKLREEKLASWTRLVETSGQKNPWGIPYKCALDRLRREESLCSLNSAAGPTSDWTGTANVLLQSLSPDDDPDNDNIEHARVRDLVNTAYHPPNGDEDARPVGRLELTKAIKRLTNGKSPGLDGIEVEFVKRALVIIPSLLLKMYNLCLTNRIFPKQWKIASLRAIPKGGDRDAMDPKSYRPICLLPILGKIYERLLLNRLDGYISRGPLAADRQFGFRAGRGTEDALMTAIDTVKESHDKYILGIALDISGAFDNLWWPSIFRELRERDCPLALYGVLQDYLSDRKVAVAGKHHLVEKPVTKGCPQGSVLGPSLWNLVFDGLIRILENDQGCVPIAYADDVLVLIPGNSRREIERKALTAFGLASDWCASRKLDLSSTKTQMIVLKGHLARQPAIRIGDTVISAVTDIRYLGINLSNNLKVKSHIHYAAGKSKEIFFKLSNITRKRRGLSYQSRIILYKGLCVPILTYGAIGWADRMNDSDRKHLISAQRTGLLAVTGAYRTTSSAALCVVSGQLPIDLKSLERSLAFKIRKRIAFTLDGEDYGVDDGDEEDDRSRLKAAFTRRWQARWEVELKGRVTAAFFANIGERLVMDWLKLDQHVTQFLTGHGNFRAKLFSMNLVDEEWCECGAEETSDHVLFHCPRYGVEREQLVATCAASGRAWPTNPGVLVTKEIFPTFAIYCREVLERKRREELELLEAIEQQ